MSNIEIEKTGDDEFEAGSNFLLAEQNIQSHHQILIWAGRAEHKLRRVDGDLKMHFKKILLINGDEPIPTLSFLI